MDQHLSYIHFLFNRENSKNSPKRKAQLQIYWAMTTTILRRMKISMKMNLQEVPKMPKTLKKKRVTKRERAPKDTRRVKVLPKNSKRVSKSANSQFKKAMPRSNPKRTYSWIKRLRLHLAMKMNRMIQKLRSRIVKDNTTLMRHWRESMIRQKNLEKLRKKLKKTFMIILTQKMAC